jgi:tetratricopeptide (TPR) repeat protein
MILYIRPLSYLLPLLIIQACATHQPQQPKPYHPKPPTQQSETRQSTIPPVAPTKNPIVQNIQAQATQLRNRGQLGAAAQTLERGLRIAPKDASLWSQLATVRLQQQQYSQAQSMAKKSNNLARTNTSLIQKNNSIIIEAQKQQR